MARTAQQRTYFAPGQHPTFIGEQQRTPFRFIDVQDYCLSPLPTGAECLCMSYVCGETSKPITTQSTVQVFYENDGLPQDLPQTIRDALMVTRKLGFRYLWVDALSIIQDDSHDMQSCINNMQPICLYAALTVVAASGRYAQAGISSLNDPLARKVDTRSFVSYFRLGILPFFDGEMMRCKHAYRCWTLVHLTPWYRVYADILKVSRNLSRSQASDLLERIRPLCLSSAPASEWV
jgi:hypothetical protein